MTAVWLGGVGHFRHAPVRGALLLACFRDSIFCCSCARLSSASFRLRPASSKPPARHTRYCTHARTLQENRRPQETGPAAQG